MEVLSLISDLVLRSNNEILNMSIGEKRLACQEKIWGIKNIDLDKFLLHDKFHV